MYWHRPSVLTTNGVAGFDWWYWHLSSVLTINEVADLHRWYWHLSSLLTTNGVADFHWWYWQLSMSTYVYLNVLPSFLMYWHLFWGAGFPLNFIARARENRPPSKFTGLHYRGAYTDQSLLGTTLSNRHLLKLTKCGHLKKSTVYRNNHNCDTNRFFNLILG